MPFAGCSATQAPHCLVGVCFGLPIAGVRGVRMSLALRGLSSEWEASRKSLFGSKIPIQQQSDNFQMNAFVGIPSYLSLLQPVNTWNQRWTHWKSSCTSRNASFKLHMCNECAPKSHLAFISPFSFFPHVKWMPLGQENGNSQMIMFILTVVVPHPLRHFTVVAHDCYNHGCSINGHGYNILQFQPAW